MYKVLESAIEDNPLRATELLNDWIVKTIPHMDNPELVKGWEDSHPDRDVYCSEPDYLMIRAIHCWHNGDTVGGVTDVIRSIRQGSPSWCRDKIVFSLEEEFYKELTGGDYMTAIRQEEEVWEH